MPNSDTMRTRLNRAYLGMGQRIWGSCGVDDLPTSVPVERWMVHPEAPIAIPPARQVGGPRVGDPDGPDEDILATVPDTFPATGVIGLRNMLVGGTHGWVVTPEDVLIEDSSWYGARFKIQVPTPLLAPRVRHLRGVTLSLCSEFAMWNYGHALFDLLPRIDLFERSGIGYEGVDQILCNLRERDRPLLEKLGVPMDRIIWTGRLTTYRTDRLLITSLPGVRRVIPPWAVEFLRTRLAPTPAGEGRRLFIVRRSPRRMITDESALLPILRDRGFELFEPGSASEDPRAAFAAASMIAGAHGAGLVDVIFSPPGTQLLEIQPTDWNEPYECGACAAAGVDYRYITAPSATRRTPNDFRASAAHITVDPDVFAAALDGMIADAG